MPQSRKITHADLVALGGQLAEELVGKDARFESFYNYRPIDKLLRPNGFFASPAKTKALIGANKSTKTTAGALEAVMVYVGVKPKSLIDVYPHDLPQDRPRRVRIIVQNYSKHWPETVRPLLIGDPQKGHQGFLPAGWSKWNEAEHMFLGPDGSYLSIVAVDPHERIDPNVLRGPLIDHTWIDELNQEVAYSESLARGVSLEDGPRTVTLTFCPQEGRMCWTYKGIYGTQYNLRTKKRKPPEQCAQSIFVEKVSMRDNPSISADQIQSMIESIPPWQVSFRIEGDYGEKSENPYFNYDTLIAWEEAGLCTPGDTYRCVPVKNNPEQGDFQGRLQPVDAKFADEEQHDIWRLWELPKVGNRYVVTADAAEGNPNGDFSSIGVWRVESSNQCFQVAQLYTRTLRAGEAAVQACCMANVFGNSLLVPESNSTAGGIFLDRARNYRNLYRRLKGAEGNQKQSDRPGWHTDKHTKGPMLETTYKTIESMSSRGECPIRSETTLGQLLAYEVKVIRDRSGIFNRVEYSARVGEHDDAVIEMAMALRVARYEFFKISPCKSPPSVLGTPLSEWKKREYEAKKQHARYGWTKKLPNMSELRKGS